MTYHRQIGGCLFGRQAAATVWFVNYDSCFIIMRFKARVSSEVPSAGSLQRESALVCHTDLDLKSVHVKLICE